MTIGWSKGMIDLHAHKIKTQTTTTTTTNKQSKQTIMKLSTTSITTLFFFAGMISSTQAGALRGNTEQRYLQQDTDAPTASPSDASMTDADEDPVSSAEYTGLQICTQAHSVPSNNKYFWMTMVNSDKDSLGSCLVTLVNDTDEVCCTLPGTVLYSDNNNVIVSDPATITNTTSQAYAACGANGGALCPDYSFDTNEQNMGYIQILDPSGNGLRHPQKFIHKQGDSKCGLGDSLGNADCSGVYTDVYGYFKVGKQQCLESVITLSKHCSGHFGYECKDSQCNSN